MPPALQGANPVAAVVIAIFEFIFYWCIILGVAALWDYGWQRVEKTWQTFIGVILVFVAYYGLWVISRFIQPVSYAVYGVGIAFPLLSAMITRDWSTIGFTGRNWKPALLWGAAVGLVLLVGIVIVPGVLRLQPSPETHPRQLVGGIALSLLVISPFQEFLFRGWMQPRL